jgi:hypothetical protein
MSVALICGVWVCIGLGVWLQPDEYYCLQCLSENRRIQFVFIQSHTIVFAFACWWWICVWLDERGCVNRLISTSIEPTVIFMSLLFPACPSPSTLWWPVSHSVSPLYKSCSFDPCHLLPPTLLFQPNSSKHCVCPTPTPPQKATDFWRTSNIYWM